MQLPGVASLRTSALAPAASASRGSIFLTIMEATLAVGLALMLISLSLDIFAVFVTGTLLVVAIRYAARQHHPRTGAIVLVGNTPLAAILAASLEQKHPHHVQQIVRAEHMSAATILVRQIACAEVVVVDENTTTTRPLVDSRGFPAPLT
ncbi:MAG TPA: hypothetical protein PK819_14780, partial [Thermomicrobiales bacterium]|nr:hypothetical protein [Thermomicrobiales bacterium]